MNDIKAIIFDMDGVLIDSESVVAKCWKKVAQEYGLNDIENTNRKCLGLNKNDTKEILKNTYGQNFDAQNFLEKCSLQFAQYSKENKVPVKPFAKECLEYLKSLNIRLALASSSSEAAVKRELTNANLYDYFETFTTGNMVEHSKPEPDIYLKACASLGLSACECVAIEDSFNGVKSAFAANMKCIMIPDLVQPTQEILKKVWKLCKNLDEIKTVIY